MPELNAADLAAIEKNAPLASPSKSMDICEKLVPRLCETIRAAWARIAELESTKRRLGWECFLSDFGKIKAQMHNAKMAARIAELEAEAKRSASAWHDQSFG